MQEQMIMPLVNYLVKNIVLSYGLYGVSEPFSSKAAIGNSCLGDYLNSA